MMETLTLWVSILTFLFVLESSLLVYFARWIIWRWNTVVQELLVAKHSNSESNNDEGDEECG